MRLLFQGILKEIKTGEYNGKPQFSAEFERQLFDENQQPTSVERRSISVRPEVVEELRRYQGKEVLLQIKAIAWKTGKGINFYDGTLVKAAK
jgi:hypothetical protein